MDFRKNFNLERQQLQKLHRQQLEEKYLEDQKELEFRKIQRDLQVQKEQERLAKEQKDLAKQINQQAQEIQADLDNILDDADKGFLGSFLSKNLKTNQLVVNTDEKTLRPIARLKEPRDLFALPKDKDNDCSQQAPRWPIECQVLDERIIHIPYVPAQPEPFNQPTGNELKPRPVGEENGIVVFNYNPISAVNYLFKQDINSSGTETLSNESVENVQNYANYANCAKPYSTEIPQKVTTTDKIGDYEDDDDDEDENSTNSDQQQNDEQLNKVHATIVKPIANAEQTPGDKQTEKPKPFRKPMINSLKNARNRLAQLKNANNSSSTSSAATIRNKKIIDVQVLWSRGNDSDSTLSPSDNMEIAGYKNIAYAPVRLSPSQLSRLEEPKPIAVTKKISISKLKGGTTNSSESDSSDSSTDSSEGENECGIDTSSQHSLVANIVIPSYEPVSKKLQCYQFLKPNKQQNQQQPQNLQNPQKSNADTVRTGAVGDVAQGSSVAKGGDGVTVVYPPPTARFSSSSMKCKSQYNNNDSDQKNTNSNNDFSDFNLQNNSNPNNCCSDSNNMSLPQFSRSSVGGAKFLSNCHPYDPNEYDGLEFESRFESGNLAKAVQITRTYYELYLRPDLYTSRSKQWFYFRVKRTRKDLVYRFSIVNLVKSDSLYNEGMRPVMYSVMDANKKNLGWRRCGENIAYYRNDEGNNESDDGEDNSSYTLTFNIEFPNDDDTVYFAHSYPYTYSDLQDYLMDIQKHPVKSQFCKLRLLCRTLAGNNVYYLTVTSPSSNEEAMKRKKSIVVSARVHPSETPASWMMKGLMDFITGDTTVAKKLRHRFIFKLIPMLNPDGVIVGNTRNSLTGKDLNRQYRTVIRETYPSIWYTKALIKRLIDECGVTLYCDMHAHSRKHNIFIYGCENKRNPEKKLTEQVFPLMLHKNVADRFSFESCKFKIQRSKEGTGRIVVWMLGITNSYTIEASFGGSTLGSRKNTQFSTYDYEHMGKAFCETLLDYCDENPNKVKKNEKILKQIKKIRKREKREQKALKLKKMAEQERLRLKIIERLLKEGSSADEPLNIPLSDYSSDEGNCSSSSDNEGKESITLSDLEGPCCKAPPCSPEAEIEQRRFRYKRMRKVMQRLDQVYFQPLLHKKFEILLKGQKIKQKSQRIVKTKKPPTKPLVKESEPNTNANNGTNTRSKNLKINVKQQLKQQVPSRASNQLFMQNSSSQIDLESSATALHSNSVSETDTSNEVSRDPRRLLQQKQVPKKKKPIRLEKIVRSWLLERNIVITKKTKRRRKNIKRKPNKVTKKQPDRLPLDMPTTDPGSDLHFSTDDEFTFNYNNQTTYGTVPRMRRSVLLQSELQRRYIEEEIGDACKKDARMPPELIVTSPGKHKKLSPNQQHYASLSKPNTAPNKLFMDTNTANGGMPGVILASFPHDRVSGGGGVASSASGELTKRTNSWHNLNASASRLAKLKQAHTQYANANDDLQFRLSLKKKLWTGAPNTTDTAAVSATTTNERTSRPMSWYHSIITKNVPFAAKNKLSIPSKEPKRVDSDAGFLNACSEKLLQWQQKEKNEENTKRNSFSIAGGGGGGSSSLYERKNKTFLTETANDGGNGQEESTLRVFRQIVKTQQAEPHLGQKQNSNQLQVPYTVGGSNQDNPSNSNKRSMPLAKLAETTQMVTRLTKTKQLRSKTSNTRLKKSSTSLNTISSQQKINASSTNKFKTGGIVVTAVQPTAKKTKKLKSVTTTHTKTQVLSAATATTNTAVPAISNVDSFLNIKDKHQQGGGGDLRSVVDSKTMLRKLKTKLKKKSSATTQQQKPLLTPTITTTTVEDIAGNLIAATVTTNSNAVIGSNSAPATRTLQPYNVTRKLGTTINNMNLLRKQT